MIPHVFGIFPSCTSIWYLSFVYMYLVSFLRVQWYYPGTKVLVTCVSNSIHVIVTVLFPLYPCIGQGLIIHVTNQIIFFITVLSVHTMDHKRGSQIPRIFQNLLCHTPFVLLSYILRVAYCYKCAHIFNLYAHVDSLCYYRCIQ